MAQEDLSARSNLGAPDSSSSQGEARSRVADFTPSAEVGHSLFLTLRTSLRAINNYVNRLPLLWRGTV